MEYKTDICRLSFGTCKKYARLINNKIKKNKKFMYINISIIIFLISIIILFIIMIVYGLKK